VRATSATIHVLRSRTRKHGPRCESDPQTKHGGAWGSCRGSRGGRDRCPHDKDACSLPPARSGGPRGLRRVHASARTSVASTRPWRRPPSCRATPRGPGCPASLTPQPRHLGGWTERMPHWHRRSPASAPAQAGASGQQRRGGVTGAVRVPVVSVPKAGVVHARLPPWSSPTCCVVSSCAPAALAAAMPIQH
jgi:hypothetical protein